MKVQIDKHLYFKPQITSAKEGNRIRDLQNNLMLIIPKSLKSNLKEVLIDFTKLYDVPYVIVDGKDDVKKFVQIRDAHRNYEPRGMLIIGTINHLEGRHYNTVFGNHYGDNVFQDPENSGIFTVPVGRVSGDINTILHHVLMVTGDSDKALVFLPQNSSDNELALEGIQKLGLDSTVINQYDHKNHESLLQDAEIIFQFSNSGSDQDVIHGNLSGWSSKRNQILYANDLLRIKFNNYPLIFSQACNTGNFGTLAQQFLHSRACYFGSSSPTYSFMGNVNFSDWQNNVNSDGWKIGFLDLLDEKKNIGDIKIEIENQFMKRLNIEESKLLQSFLSNQTHKLSNFLKVMTVVQYQFFGNPLRFSTVGMKPDFDLVEVN